MKTCELSAPGRLPIPRIKEVVISTTDESEKQAESKEGGGLSGEEDQSEKQEQGVQPNGDSDGSRTEPWAKEKWGEQYSFYERMERAEALEKVRNKAKSPPTKAKTKRKLGSTKRRSAGLIKPRSAGSTKPRPAGPIKQRQRKPPGTPYTCPSCGKRFFGRSKIVEICPYCGEGQPG